MIKTVKKITTITNRYQLPINIYKLSQKIDGNEFLTGGFYSHLPLARFVLYFSDENGIISNNDPLLMEEGINSEEELFNLIGYTYID